MAKVLDKLKKSEQELHSSSFIKAQHAPPVSNAKICIALVGLPARGKTYIARKLARYLNWIGVNTKVFNVGEYRRNAVGAEKTFEFFHPDNKEATEARRKCAIAALQDVQKFLEEGGDAAVFDATNSTKERRQLIIDHCQPHSIKVFFIESICDDPELVDENIKAVKLSSPDYSDRATDEAIEDFKKRIEVYKLAYCSLDKDEDKELSWVKIFNVKQRYEANQIEGHLQARLVYYLMNIHIRPRSIYLCRHGESICNMYGRIGGDSELSERGFEFARKLSEYISTQDLPGLKIWTSQLKRTKQTAELLDGPKEQWRALNELDVGDCEALSYEQIQEKFPREFALRDQDKYRYRYPRGESYEDLVHRLEPVIMELERQDNVLVICHQAVSRCILAYFLDKSNEELPYIRVPLHSIIKLTPVAYGCKVESHKIDVPCVDTYRGKPENLELTRSGKEALGTVPQHFDDTI
ncbi:PREDICTED: 6-phosphofructo-2-kinase/fructose-2,6-bisphosphatase 1-like [Amphimedon queenslandica]|uniref:6-phosphofructo-2-kinase domain-containing protein n=1 Tax=Amphimedon queenslandica TaxID=400682 RepID=A0A1X7VRX4_AMPQE|nr:PREDICTED: 6-phosphofructo-2-kinase/fructose-2,6-bisphosphatase 1-like [Amphimedon queenslandica]|eukprot:XP_003382978.1 PREDICTED: 6-phosphofructo-2-kinase/fructose-2,6-bisphosphatase 1-like [Amphimedon queenslandica]